MPSRQLDQLLAATEEECTGAHEQSVGTGLNGREDRANFCSCVTLKTIIFRRALSSIREITSKELQSRATSGGEEKCCAPAGIGESIRDGL
jgi:hypothetical protein